MAELPSLSVILPTFNECGWLTDTIQAIDRELLEANWSNAEILVINDGSTDDTVTILANLQTNHSLAVVSQENMGRFRARLNGLQISKGDFVLLIDSRVHANPGSFSFLANQLVTFPDRKIWNGDVDIANSSEPAAAFWLCMTRLAWRRYFGKRRLTSFDNTDFDFFPKGTTFFLAPRELLLDACMQLNSHFTDKSLMNDDTLLIRPLAYNNRIYISPDFRCTYFSRDTTKKFRKHSFHRGTVFVDAYFRRGSRYLPYFLTLIALALLALPVLLIWPIFALGLALVLSMIPVPIFLVLRLSFREILGFYRALPHFVPMYTGGIIRGLFLMLQSRLNRVRG